MYGSCWITSTAVFIRLHCVFIRTRLCAFTMFTMCVIKNMIKQTNKHYFVWQNCFRQITLLLPLVVEQIFLNPNLHPFICSFIHLSICFVWKIGSPHLWTKQDSEKVYLDSQSAVIRIKRGVYCIITYIE